MVNTVSFFFSPLYSPKSPLCHSLNLSPRRAIRSPPTCCLSIKRTNGELASAAIVGVSAGRVVFAAGGTAGHISPAVAIADKLKLEEPSVKVLFLGCDNSLESATVPASGFDFEAVSAVRLNRPILSLRNFFVLPFHVFRSTREALKILRDFQPQLVIGTGGYVSFPICVAAVILRIRLVIQEQNSIPGVANRFLSLFAHSIYAPFNCTVSNLPSRCASKCLVFGNPIHLELTNYVSKTAARVNFFGKRSGSVAEAKVVLVLGGSLGANAINIALLNGYSQLLIEHENWYIIWQTGVRAFDEMDSLVLNHPRLFLTPFLNSMDMAYAAADLVVSRAGAMTCSEIMATGKPSLLIPSPNAAEGHQVRNASLMADIVGSRVITEDELDSTTLQTAMEEILGDQNLMAEMSERALKASKRNAASEIAQHILSLITSPSPKIV